MLSLFVAWPEVLLLVEKEMKLEAGTRKGCNNTNKGWMPMVVPLPSPTRYWSRTETRWGHDGTRTANVIKSEPLSPSYLSTHDRAGKGGVAGQTHGHREEHIGREGHTLVEGTLRSITYPSKRNRSAETHIGPGHTLAHYPPQPSNASNNHQSNETTETKQPRSHP